MFERILTKLLDRYRRKKQQLVLKLTAEVKSGEHRVADDLGIFIVCKGSSYHVE